MCGSIKPSRIVFESAKVVSTKTLLLQKKDYRHQWSRNLAGTFSKCFASISNQKVTEVRSEKKQPKDKVFGQDIPGTSGTQTLGYPGQKLYASGPFLLF